MSLLSVSLLTLALSCAGAEDDPCVAAGCDPTVTEEMIDECTTDAECIVVPYDHCCGSTKRAINADHRDEYDAHPAWQSYHEEDCAVMGACQLAADVTEATCDPGGTCRLVFPGP